MALVLRRDGCRMSPDRENIHPFFRPDAQKVAISAPLSAVQPVSAPALQQHDRPVTKVLPASNQEVVIRNDEATHGPGAEHETNHISGPLNSKNLPVKLNTLQDAHDISTLAPKSKDLALNDGKPLRKRRKVTKPESLNDGKQGTLPWHQPPALLPKDDRNSGDMSQVEEQGVTQSTQTSVPSSTLPSDAEPVIIQQIEPSTSKMEHTPVRKIMKLRTDGRLFSPPKKEKVIDSAKRSRKSDLKHRKHVAVLRYGDTAESRREIGEKIERILKGEVRIKPREEDIQRSQTADVKVEAPIKSEPHPFFLTQRKVEGHKQHLSIPSQSDGKTSRSTSPRRHLERIAGKPPAALLFGASTTKSAFPPDAKQPLWPPKEMFHVRDLAPNINSVIGSSRTQYANIERKAKESAVYLKTQEEVWDHIKKLVSDSGLAQQVREDSDAFSIPKRRIVRRSELQGLVSSKLNKGSYHGSPKVGHETYSSTEPYHCVSPAAQKLFDTLPTAKSAFDAFKCESQEWTVKYAPKSSMDILQPQESMQLFRDWLLGSTVHSTTSHASTTITKTKGKPGRKRKPTSELDDFIIDSDDDDAVESPDQRISHEPDMTGFNFDKSAPRRDDSTIRRFSAHTLPQTKAVILSGPHGCGKTAAIYAIAQELGFEIFEINASSKRSGRDILEKVGDMTKNHLVSQLSADSDHHQGSTDEHSLDIDEVQQEIASGKQSTMQSFFQKKQVSKTTKNKLPQTNPPANSKPKRAMESNKVSKAQKQSLILLEEVDILFEEDKQFWSTIVALMATSKRPIVMTCNDESLLPSEVLQDCSLLRFGHSPKATVTEYLLLMAAHEGHLLTEEAISTLYTQTGLDLRASIMQLNFWCQMAIRDNMGGLNWILFPQDYRDDKVPITERRVMSEGTFLTHIGVLGNNQTYSTPNKEKHMQRMYDAALEWDFHIEDLLNRKDKHPEQASRIIESSYNDLSLCDLVYDALSAAEILRNTVFSDDIQPDDYFSYASEVQRFNNFTINPPVLQTIAEADMLTCDPDITTAISYYAQAAKTSLYDQSVSCFGYDDICDSIVHRKKPLSAHHVFIKETMWNALDPLTEYCSQSYKTIASDIAPYVRSIASYDNRLEQERARLNKLLSDGTRSGKRQRTTRASRAALEGGHKASTRREKWFECELDLQLILETGGTDWQDLAWGRFQKEIRRLRWAQQAENTESEDELCS